MIFMLDASGSLKEDGFAIPKKFTADIMMKYQAKHLGADAMKMGVATCGTGEPEFIEN